MTRVALVCTCFCAAAAAAAPTPSASAAAPVSGVDTQYADDSVRPQDDFYRHLNGKWLDSFQIPSDQGRYGAFDLLRDTVWENLRGVLEGLAQPAPGSEARKVADLYASFMDEAKLETLGLRPLAADFLAIESIHSKRALAAMIAHFNRINAGAPYDLSIEPDARKSSQYAAVLRQSGLGMPDRDYYLKDDLKLRQVREAYRAHMEKMLRMAGDQHAADAATAILALETAMARVQWTRVENRDPIKTYNKTPIADLPKLLRGYDWKRYLAGAGLEGKADYLIVRQPGYFSGLGSLLANTPLPAWKSYLKWHVLSAAAPYLSKRFAGERFAFTHTALRGIPEEQARWRRGVELVDRAVGEALGKLYVEQYFPPENKARMDALVQNLVEAYRQDIDTLDWMSPQTKKGAQEKLAKLVTKIGYPNAWRDYGALSIVRDDLLGNIRRASEFEYRRNLAKLGKPIDRNEWEMTPQTVNAYYEPLMNEIVFPAAILQPPFFNVLADEAVNYGGIGGVIGHEISHGFDDRGSQYDGDGNLRDWLTREDHEKFATRTRALVEQYARYEPVPGFHVNGELTLGENIADNSGLAIAFKAYEISLGGKNSPVLDGLTGEERFYYGWAQVWRGKARENETVMRIKTDPHAPAAVRGTAPLSNQAGFYAAFGVKEGDKMYVPPPQRVSIW